VTTVVKDVMAAHDVMCVLVAGMYGEDRNGMAVAIIITGRDEVKSKN
jgi:hypothetical protein